MEGNKPLTKKVLIFTCKLCHQEFLVARTFIEHKKKHLAEILEVEQCPHVSASKDKLQKPTEPIPQATQSQEPMEEEEEVQVPETSSVNNKGIGDKEERSTVTAEANIQFEIPPKPIQNSIIHTNDKELSGHSGRGATGIVEQIPKSLKSFPTDIMKPVHPVNWMGEDELEHEDDEINQENNSENRSEMTTMETHLHSAKTPKLEIQAIRMRSTHPEDQAADINADQTCSVCGKMMHGRAIPVHRRLHHPHVKRFQCFQCQYLTSRAASLWNHRKCHRLKHVTQCPYCTASFATQRGINCHLKRIHLVLQQKGEEARALGSAVVEATPKLQPLQTATVQQRVTASVANEFKCRYCSRVFPYRSILKIHESSHTLPFKCNRCHHQFGQKAKLITHEAKNHGPKHGKNPQIPGSGGEHCPKCDMVFPRYGLLIQHLRLNHPGFKPYKCKECPYSSCDIRGLKNHNIIHSVRNPKDKNQTVTDVGDGKVKKQKLEDVIVGKVKTPVVVLETQTVEDVVVGKVKPAVVPLKKQKLVDDKFPDELSQMLNLEHSIKISKSREWRFHLYVEKLMNSRLKASSSKSRMGSWDTHELDQLDRPNAVEIILFHLKTQMDSTNWKRLLKRERTLIKAACMDDVEAQRRLCMFLTRWSTRKGSTDLNSMLKWVTTPGVGGPIMLPVDLYNWYEDVVIASNTKNGDSRFHGGIGFHPTQTFRGYMKTLNGIRQAHKLKNRILEHSISHGLECAKRNFATPGCELPVEVAENSSVPQAVTGLLRDPTVQTLGEDGDYSHQLLGIRANRNDQSLVFLAMSVWEHPANDASSSSAIVSFIDRLEAHEQETFRSANSTTSEREPDSWAWPKGMLPGVPDSLRLSRPVHKVGFYICKFCEEENRDAILSKLVPVKYEFKWKDFKEHMELPTHTWGGRKAQRCPCKGRTFGVATTDHHFKNCSIHKLLIGKKKVKPLPFPCFHCKTSFETGDALEEHWNNTCPACYRCGKLYSRLYREGLEDKSLHICHRCFCGSNHETEEQGRECGIKPLIKLSYVPIEDGNRIEPMLFPGAAV